MKVIRSVDSFGIPLDRAGILVVEANTDRRLIRFGRRDEDPIVMSYESTRGFALSLLELLGELEGEAVIQA